MLYLSHFSFPSSDDEQCFFMKQKHTCFDTYYPFQILTKHNLTKLSFEAVTILYGGNGSGKTTALNVIAEKLKLSRDSLYNRTNFFEDYTILCDYDLAKPIPRDSRIITSDDCFDYMLNLRTINNGINQKREDLFGEYLSSKYSDFKLKSLDDYEQLKKVNMTRGNTQSRYVRKNLMDNVREHSNGESAFLYFTDKIKDDGLYLLDEPENSLSPNLQQELLTLISNSARFFGCQFIIATHSPFLLSMRGAKIYDMDESPVSAKKWTDLPSIRQYYSFFKQHENEFRS